MMAALHFASLLAAGRATEQARLMHRLCKPEPTRRARQAREDQPVGEPEQDQRGPEQRQQRGEEQDDRGDAPRFRRIARQRRGAECALRSEEHTSELQSLMRTSYAVFCLQKTKNK